MITFYWHSRRDDADVVAADCFVWLEAVDRAAGAVVLVVDSHSAVDDWAILADGVKARSGCVPAVQRTG